MTYEDEIMPIRASEYARLVLKLEELMKTRDALHDALSRLLGATERGNSASHDPGCGCVIHESEAALTLAGVTK